MSWLDPERLSALYGKKPATPEGRGPMDVRGDSAKSKKKSSSKDDCCEKFKKGKRCKDCPNR